MGAACIKSFREKCGFVHRSSRCRQTAYTYGSMTPRPPPTTPLLQSLADLADSSNMTALNLPNQRFDGVVSEVGVGYIAVVGAPLSFRQAELVHVAPFSVKPASHSVRQAAYDALRHILPPRSHISLSLQEMTSSGLFLARIYRQSMPISANLMATSSGLWRPRRRAAGKRPAAGTDGEDALCTGAGAGAGLLTKDLPLDRGRLRRSRTKSAASLDEIDLDSLDEIDLASDDNMECNI